MNCTTSDPCFSSPYNNYLREIKEDTLLSASEEKELAEAIARGDHDAKNRMIRANLRLVVKIAREYVGRGLVLDDLIGEGNLGLIRAAQEYDPRFGTRFSTYASYWIKQAIRHALINTTATIRLPAHMIGLMTKWRRVERSLSREQGFPPSADQVAQQLGLSETQKSLIAKAKKASHLKLESSFGDESYDWSSNMSDDSQELPDSAIEVEEDHQQLSGKLDRLDDRERAIINHRFGLDGRTPLTLKEVGKRLGVTREWVRKIEIRALMKLNDEFYERIIPTKTRHAASRTVKDVAPTAPGPGRSYSERNGADTSSTSPVRVLDRDSMTGLPRKKNRRERTAVTTQS